MTKTISGYTTTYNCLEMHYPFQETVESLLGFCDEVIVVDAGSTDGTLDALNKLKNRNPKLKLFIEPVDFTHPRWAIHQDGFLKAKARAKCTSDYCWQSDTDEVVEPSCYTKIRELPYVLGDTSLIMLPMVEFWGDLNTVRGDFFSWKPRFSVNNPDITHGIPKRYTCFDQSGHPYPKPFFSDSCNYIYKSSGEDVKVIIPIRERAQEINKFSDQEFEAFYLKYLEELPFVFHLSWLDLKRKISHYQKYWKRFHASMYNLDVIDLPENNVMFDKPWSAVTEVDIEQKAQELKRIGPRSFHHKIDPAKQGVTFKFHRPIPDSIEKWAKAHLPKPRETTVCTATIALSSYPLVSAIIPSYNKAQFLRESVGSVVSQNYQNLEILVVNDGSKDNTSEVVKALIKEFSTREIKLLEKTNGGVSDARNFGIRHARGDYIMTLDGDDLAAPTFVSKGITAIKESNSNLFCSNVELFGAKSGDWSPADYDSYFIRYHNSIPSLALYSRLLWERTGGYKVALGFVEDWDYWIACSRYDLKVAKSPEKLFRYRMIEGGLAEAHINNRHQDCQAVVTVSNEDLYPVDETIACHGHLLQVPKSTFDRLHYLDSVHPHEWFLKFWLGLEAQQSGKLEDALKHFVSSMQLSKQKNWQPILRAGFLLLQAGRGREGIEFLHLARFLRADLGRHVSEAIRTVERSLTP